MISRDVSGNMPNFTENSRKEFQKFTENSRAPQTLFRSATLMQTNKCSSSGVNASSRLGGTSLVSRLSICLTEANWWRLIAE